MGPSRAISHPQTCLCASEGQGLGHRPSLGMASEYLNPAALGGGKEQPPKEDSRSCSQRPGLAAGEAQTTGVHSSKVFP